MEQFQFSYLPTSQRIAFRHVSRPAGYRTQTIHMHDHHELVFVPTHCRFRVINNGNAVTISAPAVLMHRAGTFHEVVEVCCGAYESHVLFFHPRLLDPVPEQMQFPEQLFSSDFLALPLEDGLLEQAFVLFRMMESRSTPQQLPLLLTVFAQLADFLKQGGEALRFTAGNHYIFHVIELLQTAGPEWTLERIADRFHVCRTKLKADFKRITGMSVIAYRNDCRLENSRYLLENTRDTLAQVASRCGFSDESYFIRAFKKRYGITPSAYRKALRG